MAEPSVAELKKLLDENELDLSSRGLQVVPKGISQLPRATKIDLSSNMIFTLPPELCLLTRMVKLELASNQIAVLPDQIGNLVNLQYLDLYNNQIEELPLSFSNLKSLKYLDLKKNPLESALSKAAGDCNSTKECEAAAKKVVTFMHTRQLELNTQLAKQEKVLAKSRQKQVAVEEEKKETEKKAQKEKQAKKKAAKEKAAKEKEEQEKKQANGKKAVAPAKNDSKQQPKKEQKKQQQNNETKKQGGSMIGGLIRFLIRWSFFIALLGGSFVTVSVLLNCADGAKRIPGSAPLCADVQKITEFKAPSKDFWPNTKKASLFLYHSNLNKVKNYYGQFAKTSFGQQVDKFLYKAHAVVVEYSLLAHKQIQIQLVKVQKWWAKDGEKQFGHLVVKAQEVGGKAVELVRQGLVLAQQKAVYAYGRAENFVDLWAEHGFGKAVEKVMQ